MLRLFVTIAVFFVIADSSYAAAQDTLIMTGPNFQQLPLGTLMVTPTGGSQQTLSKAIANGGCTTNCTFGGTTSGAAFNFTGNGTVGGTFGEKGTATFLLNSGRDTTFQDNTTSANLTVANGYPFTLGSHFQLQSVNTPQNATEFNLLGYSGNNIPLSGSQSYGLLKTSAVVTGATTNDVMPNLFVVSGNALAENGPNGLYTLTASAVMGTNSSGAYTGMQGLVTVNGTGITNMTTVGGQFETTIQSNTGGISGTLSGRAYGNYIQVGANSGATFLASVAGNETDMGVQTGASAGTVSGMGAILLPSHAVHGLQNIDSAFVAGCAGCSTPWDYALRVGGIGTPFAVTSTGTIIQTVYGNSGASAAYGADLLPVNFSGAAFRSNAFSVDGSGNIQAGTCYVEPSASGASVDCSGSVATGTPTLITGGSNWPIDGQTHVATDTHGGIYVLTINGSGVVTAVTMYRAPYVSGSTPSNPITLIPEPPAAYGGATGLTINLTWQARSLLTLQPGGGAIKVGSGAFSANGSVATVMTSLGPTGSHATVQEWFTVTDASGTVRYIPAY